MRKRRIIWKVAASVAVAGLLAEGGFRFLLFGESDLALDLGIRLRNASAFVETDEGDYWKLMRRFQPARMRKRQRLADPITGWARPPYHLAEIERELAGRRPVLLFGDSYAQCTTGSEDCWEGLLARSDLADDYLLVNRGTGGFGLDQIWLSMASTLDDFAHLDPVVVVGVFLDNDLDRVVLDFRQWPKPRCRVVDGSVRAPRVLCVAAARCPRPVALQRRRRRLRGQQTRS